ncbi:uncharacterized protein LOC125520094 isoform X1 [Triticum urartu]|nr:uncharacterized protein LOC125520094 isoform X1 [Triticum urartu]
MSPLLQGAGEIGAEDKKQRVGQGGLELLGRWRRPSWFVMEAAPPASWLRGMRNGYMRHGVSVGVSQGTTQESAHLLSNNTDVGSRRKYVTWLSQPRNMVVQCTYFLRCMSPATLSINTAIISYCTLFMQRCSELELPIGISAVPCYTSPK